MFGLGNGYGQHEIRCPPSLLMNEGFQCFNTTSKTHTSLDAVIEDILEYFMDKTLCGISRAIGTPLLRSLVTILFKTLVITMYTSVSNNVVITSVAQLVTRDELLAPPPFSSDKFRTYFILALQSVT